MKKKNMATQNNTKVVFIDTNFDTHLALVVSDLDTVSDLKKRIVAEHPLCFPKIGQIQIQGIKVKRKGYFYHLSDSMLVSSVFSGLNKGWFLGVDASVLGELGQNEQLISLSSPYQLACLGIENNATDNLRLLRLEDKQDKNEEIHVVSPRVSEHTGKEAIKESETGVKSSGSVDNVTPLPGSVLETEGRCIVNHELPSFHAEGEVDGSRKGIKNDSSVHEEPVPITKKKRKSKRKKEDAVQDDNSKDDIASVDNHLGFQSNMASSFNNLQVTQSENKQDEKEDNAFDGQCVSDHTEKVVNKLGVGVKSSGNNDPGFPLLGSVPETCDYSGVNHEPSNSYVECEVDGSNKGIKDDLIVCEEGTNISVPSAKKKKKSKRKKEDTVRDDTPKEIDASVIRPGDHTVPQDIGVQANVSENIDKEIINETEALKEHQHTDSNKNKTKNDINALSMKEASETASAAKKKHKKRKSASTRDSEEVLKVDTVSPKDDAQKFDEALKERKASEDQFVLNNDRSRDDIEYEQNKVTEDILDSRPPAKKKKKGREKSGDKSLSKANLINGLMVDNASDQFLENGQKIKNFHTDQSAEIFNDADPLKTSASGWTTEGKINASNPHEIPVIATSKKDEKVDHSSKQRGVQGEKSEDGVFSKGISKSKTTIDKMEIGTDACNKGIQSTVKRTGKYKNGHDIQMEVHPCDVNEPMELNGDDENAVLGHRHESEARQTEEEREAPLQNDPKLMLLEKCSLSNPDNTDANIREINVTSKDVDVSGRTEAVKSQKRKRGISKAKKLGGGPSLSEGIGLVDASESETVITKSLKATNRDPMSQNTEAEENPSNQTEGQEKRQEEMQGTSATEKKDDSGANNAGTSEQIKTKSTAERSDKRQRGKSNNKQTSSSKSVPDMLTNDQVLDNTKPSPLSDIGTRASPTTNKTKKSRSASTKSTTKSSKSNLEPLKDSVRLEPSECQFNSGGNEISLFPSYTPEGHKLGQFEVNGAAQDLTQLSREKDDNADQQFASQKQQHEAKLSDDMLIDEMNGADRTDLETITGRNTHELEPTKEQTHAGNLSSSPQFSSKEDSDVHRIQPDKKVTKERRTGQDAKLSSRSDSAMSSIGENKKHHASATGKSINLDKRRECIPISNPKLEGSKKMVPSKAGKPSRNNVAVVGSNAQQKKSLLAGAIFKDDSSDSSEDEDGVDNSDVSTRTPSDHSLLSDFSDGDSVAGSSGARRLENGGRSSLKSNLTGTKGMSIDLVLRSSRRYKKAKTLASQLEESESQPDFVPDSLAD